MTHNIDQWARERFEQLLADKNVVYGGIQACVLLAREAYEKGRADSDWLTLRARFAMAAMQGLLARDDRSPELFAAIAVEYADALIIALQEKQP